MAFLMLAIGPISALAQTDNDVTVNSNTVPWDRLAIVAPRVALVDTEISMTVFRCSDQEPVAGASIWLVSQDSLETLKQEMAAVKGNDILNADSTDYESLLSVRGTLFGQAGADGNLWHSFDSAARYLLVAVMQGYFPDFRPIEVGVLPRALTIDAPRKAEVDEQITITVFQRGTKYPIKDAGVWALTLEQAESLKVDMTNVRESSDQASIEAAIEEVVNIHDIFLGTTNDAGKVHYAFEDAGNYLLVAVKPGCFPGFRSIAIIPHPPMGAGERPSSLSEGPANTPILQ